MDFSPPGSLWASRHSNLVPRHRRIAGVGMRGEYMRSSSVRTQRNQLSREKSMKRRVLRTTTLGSVALVVFLGTAWQVQAQDAKTPYPSMAPLDQYLMERNAEIAMARSAAPESVSRDADVLVLGRHGYETAVKGKNGFVCVVERGWMGPFDGEFAVNFWNHKLRGPLCFNPPAARSISAD